MKAIHIAAFVESLDNIQVSDVPIPTPPSNPKEPHYLIKVTHVSPTHVDTLYARGLHQNNHPKRGFIHPPFTLGTEFAGIIIKTYLPTSTFHSSSSSTPTPLPIHTRVWGASLGSFAEHLITPHSTLRPLPPSLSLSTAAALGSTTAPVSYGALTHIANLQSKETCLIHAAASGLGVAAVEIALALGAKVIATVGSPAKVTAITNLIRARLNYTDTNPPLPSGYGVINYNDPTSNSDTKDSPSWPTEVLRLTSQTGVKVVFDTIGLVNPSISACAFGARIVVLGFVGRDTQMEHVAMNRVLLKQISILGYRFGETGRRFPEINRRIWDGLMDMVDQRKVQGLVGGEVLGLERVKGAMQRMLKREIVGKVVVWVAEEREETMTDRNSNAEETVEHNGGDNRGADAKPTGKPNL